MSKLPTDVRLQVARVTAKDEWDIQELLTAIKAEVEAREISDTVKGSLLTAIPAKGSIHQQQPHWHHNFCSKAVEVLAL